MIKIDKAFIKKLRPCEEGYHNYLKHYADWSGSLAEFLELDKIPDEHKIWLFTRPVKEWERMQRRFAVEVSDIKTACPEVRTFHALVRRLYESVDYQRDIDHLKDDEYWAADRAAYRAADGAVDVAAYWAADRAAYRAAYWVTDRTAYWGEECVGGRKRQVEILKKIVKEGGWILLKQQV